ncbi:MAG: DNA primase [Magnetococcus sp. YQC-9]
MPRYPDSLVELIRDRVDLLDLIGRRVTLKKQGSAWMGLCPFHNEKSPSFSVRPDKGFKCFGCGEGGDAFGFVMKSKGVGFNEAVEELAAMTGIPLPKATIEDPEAIRRAEIRQKLFEVVAKAREFFRSALQAPGGEPARRYLAGRGLRPETVQREGLGYAPPGWSSLLDHLGGGEAAGELLEAAGLVARKGPGERPYDRFRERIVFPIDDLKGRCVGFGGRLLGPGEPKYLNSPETELFQKGRLLYGLEKGRAAIAKAGFALVVEGYMDRLALVEHGIEGVVATLGTAMTSDHLRLLWQQTRRIVFCFDGDAAGEKAAWRALELYFDGLEADRHAHFLFLPKGEDPDEVVRREGAEGFKRRIEGGIAPIDFLIRKFGEGLNASDPEGRAALLHRARPLFSKVKDPLLRELYLETLGQRLHIPLQFSQAGTHAEAARMRVEREAYPGAPAPARAVMPRARIAARRDHEQALLALALRHPQLVRAREEELSRLTLENGQLATLLAELIGMGHSFDVLPKSWPTEWFSSQQMARQAQEILRAEEVSPERIDEEFDGCLISVHVQALRRERNELMRRIELEGDPDDGLTTRCRALKIEEQRILERKVMGSRP